MVTPVFGSAGPVVANGIDLDEVFSGELALGRCRRAARALLLLVYCCIARQNPSCIVDSSTLVYD